MSKKKVHHNTGNQYAVKEVRKDVFLSIRLTEEKREGYHKAAEKSGKTTSKWATDILDLEADKYL